MLNREVPQVQSLDNAKSSATVGVLLRSHRRFKAGVMLNRDLLQVQT
jgi:hypothetical protein